MNNVTCPNCGKTVEISQAIKHQIQESILKDAEVKHKVELEKLKVEIEEKAEKRVKEELELKFKDSENELEEARQQSKDLRGELLEITKQLRFLKQKDDERELEMQKKLSLEEGKIRIDAQKKAEKKQKLKILEKEKQLQDALKSNEEMRRKLSQGSQQTQGEAFELNFEQHLKSEFPNDKILEVVKGVKGGDIKQEVWDRNGNKCGVILWELKNTKSWSEPWIEKLKRDQRESKSDYAVIVSEILPNEVETAKYHKNVWITKQSFVIGLACALRMNLIQIEMAKRASQGKKEKTDLLYSYLSGTEFRLRVEAIIDAFTNMQNEIEKEKRYFSNKWSRDEKNIRQVIDNTYGMHGDLKGIVGNVLPQIKGLDLLPENQLGLKD